MIRIQRNAASGLFTNASKILRRAGTTASLSDCLIASLALHYDAELFSLDSHFTAIQAIVPFKKSPHNR